MSAVAELEASLQALLANKPPGVTKARISSITALCVENVKSESVLVQKIWTHFKRTPATHKLGVLYVVDSVVREWIAKAIASGQDISKISSATDGTYAAGVNKITDLLPSFMNDLIATAPQDQTEKIAKLIGIWDRGNTFPKHLLSGFEQKLAAQKPRSPPHAAAQATATPSMPGLVPQAAAAPQGPSPIDILSALQQPAGAPVMQPASNGQGVLNMHTAYGHPSVPSALNGVSEMSQATPASSFSAQGLAAAAPAAALASAQGGPISAESTAALMSVLPASASTDQAKLQYYLQTLQTLVSIGVPATQWKDVLSALEEQNKQKEGGVQSVGDARPSQRDRSRSPSGRGSSNRNANGRERSPMRRWSPQAQSGKLVLHDPALLPDRIKVMSRTLFVGGTTCPEQELRNIFSQFGNVQSVIANNHKRHAFVKMCTRVESERAKEGMQTTQDPEILSRARSVKWGVGFGPRECCDYDEGISVIPIQRLTDADRRWILNAEYGGNGGNEITGGQVIEEPDIEIGAGVSSKAISLKVNTSGNEGRRNQRGRRHQDRFQGAQQGFQQQMQPQQQLPLQQQQHMGPQANAGNPNFDRVRRREEEPNMGGAPPAVPGFGFQLPSGIPPLGSMPPFGR